MRMTMWRLMRFVFLCFTSLYIVCFFLLLGFVDEPSMDDAKTVLSLEKVMF